MTRPATSAAAERHVACRPPSGADTLRPAMTSTPRTYDVRTYGCQMNVHDSERISGLMEDAGYVRAADADAADVIVFNTCAVREYAEIRLYGYLGHLRPS
jgi:tRNA-2-methylthio-N6-dimethylallyladenosine synthase